MRWRRKKNSYFHIFYFDDKRQFHGNGAAAFFVGLKNRYMDRVRVLILGLLSVVVFAGCTTTRYVPVPSVSVDSVYVDRWLRDSVYLHDSVFVNQWTQGDTVYVDKVVTKYQYKDRWRYDTVAIVRADSVQVPYPVEKQLTKWEEFKHGFQWFFIGVLIAAVSWVVVWLMKKQKNK